MSKNKKKRGKDKTLSQITGARWLPTNPTRPQTFQDKKKAKNKKAARGKVVW